MAFRRTFSPTLDGGLVDIGDGVVRKQSLRIDAGEYTPPIWLRTEAGTVIPVTELPYQGVIEAGQLEILSSDPTAYAEPATPRTGPDRYVSSSAPGGGDGTAGSPWTLAEMKANVVAGMRINLAGDFGADSYIDADADGIAGTPTEWIHFQQWDGQATATLRGGGPSNSSPVYCDATAEYLRFYRLNLQNVNTLEGGIYCGPGAQHIHAVECTIHGERQLGTQWSNAVQIAAGTGVTNDIWIDGCTITSGSDAQRLANTGDGINVSTGVGGLLSNITLVRNQIGNCGHAGIDLDRPTSSDLNKGLTIARNVIRNLWAAGIVSAAADGALIEENLIFDCATFAGADTIANSHEGIILGGAVSCVVRRNIVARAFGAAIVLQVNVFNSQNQVCTGNHVYNNTFVDCGGAFLIVVRVLSAITTMADNLVENNLNWASHNPEDLTAYDIGQGQRSCYYNGNYHRVWIDVASASEVWPANDLNGNVFRNNWFARNAVDSDNWCVIVDAVNTYYTRAQFEALNASSGNVDVGDPLLVDPANEDYRLQGASPCIDQGIPIAGQSYLGTGPDIGYHEAA